MRFGRVLCVMAALTILACGAIAQETETERDAAKDVVAKINDLETSLDVPTWVNKLTAPNPQRDQVVARAKQLWDTELQAMSDDITSHPEIGFKETRSVKILTDYLKAHNFDVTEGVANLPTAFIAHWKGGSGSPNLGIILEYDALRGTHGAFHGDQHSAQGPVGLAAAIAISEWLGKTHTPGTVTVYGTPGEEMMPPNAKADMFNAGVFNGADILVRSHALGMTTRSAPGFGICCMNIDGVRYTFEGAPAHQLAAWNGRNALEAVIHLFNNIDSVRSNLRPEAKIQGIIMEGGAAPNVVPDHTVADFYIRYPDAVYLKTVREFVDNAAKAAALSTGTKVKIDNYAQDRDGISVALLDEVGFAYMKKFGAQKVVEKPGKPSGYEETGSVSMAIPGMGFTAYSSDFANHTYGMEADAMKPVGHQGFLIDAQAMTALLYDFATHPDYRTAVKREFDTIKTLFGEYTQSLEKVYTVPPVADPK